MTMNRLSKTYNLAALYPNHFIEPKVFYTMKFGSVPSIAFIGELDTGKALAFLKKHFAKEMKHVYEHAYFDHAKGEMLFNHVILVLGGFRIIEVGNDYVQVLYSLNRYDETNALIKRLAEFKLVARAAIGFARSTAN